MGRPRGFVYDYKPKEDRALLIQQVQGIIADSTILPLTIRQIFYMLVSDYHYDKTERAYKRLCEALNMARRGEMIDMDDIRDDGLTENHTAGWGSKAGFLIFTQRQAQHFTLDRQDDQEQKVFVWCEAGGMVPQLADAVREWHIPVLSSGGFDSVTTKHNFAKRISAMGDQVTILHLGDHDPSGIHMFGSLDEDVSAFVDHYGGYMEMERIAVTPDQVMEMGLLTAPPKATDNRSFVGLTTQCEAIPPVTLREIVRENVLRFIDLDVLDETKAKEKQISEELVKKFGNLLKGEL